MAVHVCDGSDRQKDLYLNIQFSGKLTSDRIFGNQSSAAVVLLALGSVQEYAPEYATLEEVQRRIFLPPNSCATDSGRALLQRQQNCKKPHMDCVPILPIKLSYLHIRSGYRSPNLNA